uniref:Single domain-containing protein n=1 Tax=Amblyomma triste TaxID=251400 RepID=A0A023G9K7_AMBTT
MTKCLLCLAVLAFALESVNAEEQNMTRIQTVSSDQTVTAVDNVTPVENVTTGEDVAIEETVATEEPATVTSQPVKVNCIYHNISIESGSWHSSKRPCEQWVCKNGTVKVYDCEIKPKTGGCWNQYSGEYPRCCYSFWLC